MEKGGRREGERVVVGRGAGEGGMQKEIMKRETEEEVEREVDEKCKRRCMCKGDSRRKEAVVERAVR